MKSRIHSIKILVALVAGIAPDPSTAAERMVGIIPSDGSTMFVKRFPVTAGVTILGVEFENNDPRTIFPEVLLVRGASATIGSGTVVSRATSVSETTPGVVRVLWSEPVLAPNREDYYVAVRIPAGAGKQGPRNGPALGANRVTVPNGSFAAGGSEGELVPIGLDLAQNLVTDVAGKASTGSSLGPDSRFPRTFLKVGSPNSGSVVRIEFGVERDLPARLVIYDVGGRQVRLLHDGSLDVGTHSRTWDGRGDGGAPVAAGVYIVRLHAGENVLTQKIVIAK